MIRYLFFSVMLLSGAGFVSGPAAQQPPAACETAVAAHSLDFWLGEWEVYDQQNNLAGHNRIEKELAGCAILEHWTGTGGSEGKSLFYFDATNQSWHQVWVTPFTNQPGGLKHKTLIERFENGAIRFQGRIPLPNGSDYLDRTTLTPTQDGKVRQVIEISRDEGENWRVTFDAIYIRTGGN